MRENWYKSIVSELEYMIFKAEFDFDEMGFNFAKKDASRFVGILKSKEDIWCFWWFHLPLKSYSV